MKTKLRIGAVLLALALCILPVAAFHVNLFMAVLSLGCLAAGVTVTYATFQDGTGPHQGYTGGTTPPAAYQAQTVNAVVADVVMADGETTAAIVHNMNISTAARAAKQPYINWYIATAGSAVPLLSFAITDANTVTVTKDTGTGGGGTFRVTIRRPYSASQ